MTSYLRKSSGQKIVRLERVHQFVLQVGGKMSAPKVHDAQVCEESSYFIFFHQVNFESYSGGGKLVWVTIIPGSCTTATLFVCENKVKMSLGLKQVREQTAE